MTTKTGIGSYPADEPDGASSTGDNQNGAGTKKVKSEQSETDIQEKLDRYRDEMAEDAPASDNQADRN